MSCEVIPIKELSLITRDDYDSNNIIRRAVSRSHSLIIPSGHYQFVWKGVVPAILVSKGANVELKGNTLVRKGFTAFSNIRGEAVVSYFEELFAEESDDFVDAVLEKARALAKDFVGQDCYSVVYYFVDSFTGDEGYIAVKSKAKPLDGIKTWVFVMPINRLSYLAFSQYKYEPHTALRELERIMPKYKELVEVLKNCGLKPMDPDAVSECLRGLKVSSVLSDTSLLTLSPWVSLAYYSSVYGNVVTRDELKRLKEPFVGAMVVAQSEPGEYLAALPILSIDPYAARPEYEECPEPVRLLERLESAASVKPTEALFPYWYLGVGAAISATIQTQCVSYDKNACKFRAVAMKKLTYTLKI